MIASLKTRTRDTRRRGGKRVVCWFGCPNSSGHCAFFGVAPSSEYPNEFGGWCTGNVHYPEQTQIPGFAQRHKIIPKDGVTSQEDDDDEEITFIGRLTQIATWHNI